MFEGIRIIGDFVDEIRILEAVLHEVGRLDYERFHIVCDSPVERFLHVVDFDFVAGLDMVNDDLAGECTADAVIRKFFRKFLLDRADREPAAVIVARAEADDEKLLFADSVRVQRIVQRCVTGVIVLLVRFLCCALRSALCFAFRFGFTFRLCFCRSALRR